MEILNDVKPLSKKLQVTQLREGEVAVFRLTRAFLKDGLHEDPMCPEVAQYSGVESILDMDETPGVGTEKKEKKWIKKKVGTRILDYKQVQNQLKPIYEPVIFIRGEKRVTWDNPEMFEFMMRSKHSGANRFRKQMGAKGAPSWILLGQELVVNQLVTEELKYQAEKAIRDADVTGLKNMAMKMNGSPDQRLHIASYRPGLKEDMQAIKLELILKAKTYFKQILYATDDIHAKLKVEIYDGLNYGILFNDKNKGFQLMTEKDDFVDLIVPEAGKDSIESLKEYFESEKGQKHYEAFLASLKRALKITA